MTPLERLGLEVVAYRLLGSRVQSSILVALLMADGQPLSSEQLSSVRPSWWNDVEDGRNSIRVHISRARRSLGELGLKGVIYNVFRVGYAINKADRERVIARLVEEAK